MNNINGPKVLLLDIETAPILASVWALFDQNVAVNQIKSDWFILSWAAKWLHEPASKMMYEDQRNAPNVEDDKQLLKGIWKLLDEADIIITQNGRQFDQKKLNARFIINGYKPPSSFKHIDTKLLAKKYFAFTSNGLEYMSNKLNIKYKKLKHKKYSGFSLWSECLKGNKSAWMEMEKYNKYDVLALEELYIKLIPWDNNTVNFNLYTDLYTHICKCGSGKFKRNGFRYTKVGKFQRYCCQECGSETADRKNLFSKAKKASIKN